MAPPPPAIWEFLGISSAEEYEQGIEVWEDNWPIFIVFTKMSTQWRCGPGGPVGLDYNVAKWLFELHDIQDQRQALSDLRMMEAAALKEIASQNED